MKKLLAAAAALSMLIAPMASAQPPGSPPPDGSRFGQRPGDSVDSRYRPRWSAGDRLPPQYRQRQHYVEDWQKRGLRRPPKGYRWIRYNDTNYFLVALATGLIAQTVYRDERDQSWDRRYSQRYTYQDDIYYRECRKSPDPAGVLIGALIGGLIGDAIGDDRGSGGAILGVILGGAMGAALTQDLDCEDRSYAYRSYYDGFNSGRPGSIHRWRNPRNGRYGQVRIDGYYNDAGGFRCTNFTQTIYIDGRPRLGRGRACRQPDGSWAIVN
ncbi:MAG: RcnB family protein [Caulobacter sp.]|nr:RcnB family protein [Caulobacter sp.]